MESALGTLAVALNFVWSWPQVVRILRDKGPAQGVSAVSWSLVAVEQLGWAIFGIAEGIVPMIVANTTTGAGCLAIVAAVTMRRPNELRAVLVALIPLALIEVVLLVGMGGHRCRNVRGGSFALYFYSPGRPGADCFDRRSISCFLDIDIGIDTGLGLVWLVDPKLGSGRTHDRHGTPGGTGSCTNTS